MYVSIICIGSNEIRGEYLTNHSHSWWSWFLIPCEYLLHIVPFCERSNKKPEGFVKQKQPAIFTMRHASHLVVHHPSLIYNVFYNHCNTFVTYTTNKAIFVFLKWQINMVFRTRWLRAPTKWPSATWRWLGHGGLTPLVGHAPCIEHVLDSMPRKYSKPKPKFIISPCLHGWPFWM